MGCVTEISTMHESPGRIRLSVPTIKWQPQKKAALKAYLSELNGIYHFKACDHVGSLVLFYDSSQWRKDQLIEAVHHCPYPDVVADITNTPPPFKLKPRQRHRARRRQAAVSTPLLWEFVKHGLTAGARVS